MLGENWVRKKVPQPRANQVTEDEGESDGNRRGTTDDEDHDRGVSMRKSRGDARGNGPVSDSPDSFKSHERDVHDLNLGTEKIALDDLGEPLHPSLGGDANHYDAHSDSASNGRETGLGSTGISLATPQISNADVQWRYKDPSGQIQGAYIELILQLLLTNSII